ncbi:alpha-E domain-containing protein [Acinetobacter sp. ANC 4178]|uniref:alpha-E domain-containing protein n=1 Tax=Acinetobacter sp. ANC 4178 TaxID=2529839 RepID=UPI00103A59D1|nr:alpha-E domain-containing protein [Acinetobacter sp. ANC 4178]TCB68506.1 hypothetical protein E0H87_00735 [Acinetobacter sp. ANC 4178]
MILLSTNAQQIFWLGRYLTRIEYLCQQFPFTDDQKAVSYAHAFCLPAFDASSLNELVLDPEQPYSFIQQFQFAKDNVQELRGVFSAKTYAELNQYIRNACASSMCICDVIADCREVLEAEPEETFLFYSLGQTLEQLDRQLRLKQDQAQTLEQIAALIEVLEQMGWDSLDTAWQQLKVQPDQMNFYNFSDQIQYFFEVNA